MNDLSSAGLTLQMTSWDTKKICTLIKAPQKKEVNFLPNPEIAGSGQEKDNWETCLQNLNTLLG